MKKILILLTALMANYANAIAIDTADQPTLGSPEAPVHVVAFLEPKCPDSKKYNNMTLPRLKEDYIDKNKVKYTVIITSFLSHSMPAAQALLCVYNQDTKNPTAFFKYLDYIYANQPPEKDNWATMDTLLNLATASVPTVDKQQLKECILKGAYSDQIKKNTAYGNQLMGHLSTPTVYVNGSVVNKSDDTVTANDLFKAIDSALKEK